MSEILVVEYPKTGNNVSSSDLSDLIQNPKDQGWHFGNGDPEYWKFKDRLIVEGGKVLDLGIAVGRSSFFFALHGMEVYGLDNSKKWVNRLNRMAKTFKFPIRARQSDLFGVDLGTNLYDVVILNQVLFHLPGKKAAFDTLDKAWAATKHDGYMWVRTNGKEDDSFEFLSQVAEYDPDQLLDEDTFQSLCLCSGVRRLEPLLYLDQTALIQYFSFKGARIIHSQTIPQIGQQNIMYGEDWFNEEARYKMNGFISILAQKV